MGPTQKAIVAVLLACCLASCNQSGLSQRQEANKRLMEAASTWPTQKGKVTVSTVVSTSRPQVAGFVPRVKYQYEVDSKTYASFNYDFRGERYCKTQDEAIRLLKDYAVGTEVLVHYNPKEPSQSLLDVTPVPIEQALILK